MPLRLVSLLGIFAILATCYLCSRDRRAVSWRLIVSALALQFVLGLLLLTWESGSDALFWFGGEVKKFLDLSREGSEFVFGSLARNGQLPVTPEGGSGGEEVSSYAQLGFIFATGVLPVIIFFSSVMAIAYHLGLMQWVVSLMARVMAKLIGTSGAESLSACGNIFVGQTEAPMLVRPFLSSMTASELHAVMTGGFATIAGSVFALYVGFGADPGFLVVASVLAVPAGILCSKLLVPETEDSETMGKVVRHVEKTASNVVEAAANGAADGLKLALNVAAMLIAFLGLVAVSDWILGLGSAAWHSIAESGEMPEDYPITLTWILGQLFSPVAWLLGVSSQDTEAVGSLLGKKLILTELVAYQDLGAQVEAGTLTERSTRIATFALCGFANVGSVAIQIGGLSSMAPERKADLSKLAFRAMFAGALATCLTAAMSGLLVA